MRIETYKDPGGSFWGLEFKDESSDLCYCCPNGGAILVNLWRGNHGNGLKLCNDCARLLGSQLFLRGTNAQGHGEGNHGA